MRYLNFWDNKNFWGAKSGPLTHASSVKYYIFILKNILLMNSSLLRSGTIFHSIQVMSRASINRNNPFFYFIKINSGKVVKFKKRWNVKYFSNNFWVVVNKYANQVYNFKAIKYCFVTPNKKVLCWKKHIIFQFNF